MQVVIGAELPTLDCLLAGGLFAPASLITLLLPPIGREAELLHELKVLGCSVCGSTTKNKRMSQEERNSREGWNNKNPRATLLQCQSFTIN